MEHSLCKKYTSNSLKIVYLHKLDLVQILAIRCYCKRMRGPSELMCEVNCFQWINNNIIFFVLRLIDSKELFQMKTLSANVLFVYNYCNLGNFSVKNLWVEKFCVGVFCTLRYFNMHLITYYLCWKYFVSLIFLSYCYLENFPNYGICTHLHI